MKSTPILLLILFVIINATKWTSPFSPPICETELKLLESVKNNDTAKLIEELRNLHDTNMMHLVNQRDENSMTSLMYAAKKGFTAISGYLLRYGADAKLKDENNKTALMYACQYGHDKIVEKLIKYVSHVQVNERDAFGYSSLMYALKEGHEKIVKLLLNRFRYRISLKPHELAELFRVTPVAREDLRDMLRDTKAKQDRVIKGFWILFGLIVCLSCGWSLYNKKKKQEIQYTFSEEFCTWTKEEHKANKHNVPKFAERITKEEFEQQAKEYTEQQVKQLQESEEYQEYMEKKNVSYHLRNILLALATINLIYSTYTTPVAPTTKVKLAELLQFLVQKGTLLIAYLNMPFLKEIGILHYASLGLVLSLFGFVMYKPLMLMFAFFALSAGSRILCEKALHIGEYLATTIELGSRNGIIFGLTTILVTFFIIYMLVKIFQKREGGFNILSATVLGVASVFTFSLTLAFWLSRFDLLISRIVMPYQIVVSIVYGILAGILFKRVISEQLQFIGIILGAMVGLFGSAYVVVILEKNVYFNKDVVMAVSSILGAAIGGIAIVKLERLIMITLSSLVGAILISGSVAFYEGVSISVLNMTLFSIFFQLRFTEVPTRKEKKE